MSVSNIAQFGEIKDDGYELCLYLTDYLIDSVLDVAYDHGKLVMNTSLPIGTTSLQAMLVLDGGIHSFGWDYGQPCVAIIRAVDQEPLIYISTALGASMYTKLAMDIQCKKHSNSSDFS